MAASTPEARLQIFNAEQVQQGIPGDEDRAEAAAQVEGSHVGFHELDVHTGTGSLGARCCKHPG